MPQLNTAQWLLYLKFTWLIFLILFPTKILNHVNINKINPAITKTKNFTWTWPW